MFESHFGLRENPFASGHQPRFVYPSREHQEALAHLRYGIENREPFVLITGEVGTGKTTALFEALSGLQARVSVALLTNSALTRGELLEEICLRFNVAAPAGVSKPQAMTLLERHLLALRGRGERAILLLDEAQNFDRDLLEEIRLLSNLEAAGEKLVQIILVGQPELEVRLSTPELRQLRQRIAVHYRLRPLHLDETERYIQHRINVAGGDAPRIFPWEACAEVHAVTNGIPREINQICAQAMLDAFVDGAPAVEARHVRAAAEETSFQSVLPTSETDPRLPPLPAWPAAVAPAAPESTRTVEAPAPAAPAPAPIAPPEPPAPASHAAEPAGEGEQWQTWLAALASTAEKDVAAEAPQAGRPESPPAWELPNLGPPHAAEPSRGPEPARPETTARGAEPAPAPPRTEESARPEKPALTAVPPVPPSKPAPVPSGTRFAAESALEAAGRDRRTEDWRPPLWTREQAAEDEKRPRNTGLKLIAAIAVIAVIVVVGVLLLRFKPWKKPEAPPAVPTAVAVPGAPAGTPQRMREPVPARSESIAREPARVPAGGAGAVAGGTMPVPVAHAAPAPVTTAPEPDGASPAPPATHQEYSIIAGSYLDRSRAESELARISTAGQIEGRIAEVQNNGTTMYAVMLGAFTDRVSAERRAGDLVSKGTVEEARILSRTVPRR